MKKLAATFLVIAAACGSGGTAPPIGQSETLCTEVFCVDVPAGWSVLDSGGSYVVLARSDDADVLISIAPMNMEGVATAAGRTWPISRSEVVEALWAIVEDGTGEVEKVEPQFDGSIDSFVVLTDGFAWHRLVVTESPLAYSIELRAGGKSWEKHADLIRTTFEVLP
ncbi:MAG: hypothetical protein IIC71_01455 [Acidobacteria bacterium]|nr:hypothetical protein [Acidobacteriota bacterium]